MYTDSFHTMRTAQLEYRWSGPLRLLPLIIELPPPPPPPPGTFFRWRALSSAFGEHIRIILEDELSKVLKQVLNQLVKNANAR
mmetsp:Transcript_27227/g.76445  ORF Transcript_27227/g.76445 Transcript_27227/m.76445 type:complete len:83 (-) Transcript_27227:296-544(-)